MFHLGTEALVNLARYLCSQNARASHHALLGLTVPSAPYFRSFFQSNNFLYVHTPIITASDCEGAGEMFQVSEPVSS